MEKEGYTVFTRPLTHGPKGQQAVRNAERTGQPLQIYKKINHTNKQQLDPHKIAKILNGDESHKIPQMTHELKIAIMQGRNQKGLTQEKLAHLLNVPKSDVNGWESGKSVPNGNMIAKMDKILGVKLPRSHKTKL